MIFVLLATILSSSFLSTYAQTLHPVNLGCFSYVPGTIPGVDSYPSVAQDGNACAIACRGAGKVYGYFVATSSKCYCTNRNPSNRLYTSCTNTNVFEAWKTESQFTFLRRSTLFLNGPEVALFFVNSFKECVEKCQSPQYGFTYNWIVTEPSIVDPEWDLGCYCNFNSIPTGFPRECENQGGNFRLYAYDGAGPSQLARRKQRLDKQFSFNPEELCPEGKRACNVQGEEVGYECVDITTELESCGGCIYGNFGSTFQTMQTSSESTLGKDCTAIPGLLPSGVTCSSGQCIIHQCDEAAGYIKYNDSCVLAK